jgi:uncharacterized protein YmfQ (DUF2313 family)
MGMIAADYLKQAQALLPPGPAWPSDSDSALVQMLDAWSQEFSRVDGAALALLEEADPRTSAQMLTDWERVCALPEFAGLGDSTQERRAALHGKLTSTGGQSRAFYIALAASVGYAITITECAPHTTEDDSDHPVYDEQYRFIWYVNAALNTVRDLTTEDDTEMATAIWGNQLLEAVINRYKPAHTLAIFTYA